MIRSVLETVHFIHSKDIIHKNISPENILRSGNSVKLTGFSLAETAGKEGGISGDLAFQAPELVSQSDYGKSVDIWSVGVTTFVLLSGKRPFDDASHIKLKSIINDGKFEFGQEFSGVSNEAKDFVKSLLNKEPSKRPTAASALEHSWFKSNSDAELPIAKANLKKYHD
eukprot:TRINITY_DN5608_c0_g1_i1.p1 TRINITY_DN5608_c0_g1~~TRINITY_DN5608_c0_g1_i1.p1  ORF type:complete len:169 (+),score=46.85 TRINITY_DN5608_c0_g1_i1:663-1169(+)